MSPANTPGSSPDLRTFAQLWRWILLDPSEVALRRAVRHDGWIGDLITTDQALVRVARLREPRAENGLSMDDFNVLTPLVDAFTPEHYARAAAGGITGIVTMPWMFYTGPDSTLEQKIDGMARFRVDLGLDS